MAYTKTEWKDGTTPIDAANMNKIEDGIAANADDISSLNDDLAKIDVQTISSSGTKLEDLTGLGVWSWSAANAPTDVPFGTNGMCINIPQTAANTVKRQIWLRIGTAGSNDYSICSRLISSGSVGCWWVIPSFEYTNASVGDSSTPVYVSATGNIRACGFSYLDLVNLATDAAVAKVQGTEMPDMSILEATEEEDAALKDD